MPMALDRKYPSGGKSWSWQYCFPSVKLSVDPRAKVIRRHHADEKTVQRAVKKAVKLAGIVKLATPHTLRHSFGTHAYDNGADLLTIQHLMGHQHLSQTIQYLHLSTKRLSTVINPFYVLMALTGDDKINDDLW